MLLSCARGQAVQHCVDARDKSVRGLAYECKHEIVRQRGALLCVCSFENFELQMAVEQPILDRGRRTFRNHHVRDIEPRTSHHINMLVLPYLHVTHNTRGETQ